MSCRICFEGGDETPLIEPCNCTGSVAHIHKHCLFRWLNTKNETFPTCELCKTHYRINRPVESNHVNGHYIGNLIAQLLAIYYLQYIISIAIPTLSQEVCYFVAQLLYQSIYLITLIAMIYRYVRNIHVYMHYAIEEHVLLVVIVHLLLWALVVVSHGTYQTSSTLLLIVNQFWLCIYSILHTSIIHKMNPEHRRILL